MLAKRTPLNMSKMTPPMTMKTKTLNKKKMKLTKKNSLQNQKKINNNNNHHHKIAHLKNNYQKINNKIAIIRKHLQIYMKINKIILISPCREKRITTTRYFLSQKPLNNLIHLLNSKIMIT